MIQTAMLSYTKGKIIEILHIGNKGARRVFGLSLVLYITRYTTQGMTQSETPCLLHQYIYARV